MMFGGLKNSRGNASGFTLLELLVVILIIGIISAIAAPGWLTFISRQRMNAARTELLSTLRNAQEEATRRQQTKLVKFSSTDLTVTVITGNDETVEGVETKLGSGEVSDSSFSLVAPSPFITFDSDGRVSPDTAFPFSIKVTHNDSVEQSCVIVTTLLGGFKPASGNTCDNFDSDPT